MSRYDRQKILPGFGTEGQQKLAEAKVLIIGAGGLGCPVLLYLAAAGIGTLAIADGDSVSESNLNRQILFGQNDIGKPKAETAAKILRNKYPDINFEVIPYFLTPKNVVEVIKKFDVIVDGSDNFGTRYMINDACVLMNIPLIMGAIYQYEGQLMVFNHGEKPVNYRDIHPTLPKSTEIPNCSEAGVLGVLPGIIGNLQAAEAIKIISGIGKVLNSKILYYNLKNCGFYEVEISSNSYTPQLLPKTQKELSEKDYGISCGKPAVISWEKAFDWVRNNEHSVLIDIREPWEEPVFDLSEIAKIPMKDLEENPNQLQWAEHIMLFCKSGIRSKGLAEKLKKIFPEKKVFSVEGGILASSSPLKISKK